MEQLESAKIGFFTTRMELTPEEASKFWPVYNEYNKALCDARKATRDNYRAIRELADKGSYSECPQGHPRQLPSHQGAGR